MSEIIESIKLKLERTVQGLKTQESEFIYADVESLVPVDTTYSVYYLLDKSKVYYTKLITSKYVRKMIKVKNFDLYDEYTFIKSLKRETYPTSTYPAPSDSDYSRGIINRYFIQKVGDKTAPVLEISEADYNKQLTLYNKVKVLWAISGHKEKVTGVNYNTIGILQKTFAGISGVIWPLQFWKPPKNSPDDVAKKMLFIKTS